MSNPHDYHNHPASGSRSSKNYTTSSYNSLAEAGMSNPKPNHSIPPAGQYAGAMHPGQLYHPGAHPSSPPYQQGYVPQTYGMPGPPISPDLALNNPAQYPSMSYNTGSRTQYPSSNTMQVPPFAPGPYDTYMAPTPSPYVSSQNAGNYPYASPASAPYSGGQYPPPSSSNRGPDPSASGIKECYNCHTTNTPLWRRDPKTNRPLCNACGLYVHNRHTPRPRELIEADNDDDEEGSDMPDGPECSHCHTRQTSVWRRNSDGDHVCNACGVYQRLHGRERPLSLTKHTKPKPRAKQSQT